MLFLKNSDKVMVGELIHKYIWLLQILSAAGTEGLSLTEIKSLHERKFGGTYSRRTFNNHRSAAEEVFGVPIECNRGTNRYYIPYGGSAMDKDESISWMINTFTVGNLLTMGKERLTGRVAVEEIPSGQKYLTAIMQAMDDSREVEIEYSKYRSGRKETLHVQPFAVKEHGSRWYLVGFCHERSSGTSNSDMDAWRIYGMDRIASLKETETGFKLPPNFDVEELFSQCYGTFFPKKGDKAVTIKFLVSDNEAAYLRDLPLHSTQREETSPDGKKHIFSVRVIPNEDLIMEFCRRAGGVEVLEPASVRRDIALRLKDAADKYNITL